jgi:regulator of replication initiation timing
MGKSRLSGMVEKIDPSAIEDEGVRQIVIHLMNVVETLSAQVSELTAENQRLRDENNRLKGEQGKPRILPNKPTTDLSSEKERRQSKPRNMQSKRDHIQIDRVEDLKVDKMQLPSDAVFKGYEQIVIQDVKFQTENVCFRREKYYSASQQRTYLASLPAGYRGQFGPAVKAWVLSLYFGGRMSEPKILEVLHTVGLQISAGELSNMLIKDQDIFHAERAAVLRAGLSSSPWQHLDSTGTRVNGHNQHCHILANPLYTAYCTLPAKDRLSMLRVLQGGADPVFRCNELALALMEQLGITDKWRSLLPTLLPHEQDLTEKELDGVLEKHLPKLGVNLRKRVKEALAIAVYRTQSTYPLTRLLLCDDAPQFNALTAQLALCWIHEFRHYKKLRPRFAHHCHLLQDFGKRFWKLYHALLDYRDAPNPTQAAALTNAFDQLFTQSSGYQQLDECKARTLQKREPLLMVLSHPEILLHNNPAELGARQRVRKRDVSLQARTCEGIGAWDTFETLVATAKKLGINLFSYLYDRITQAFSLPSLASLIGERATSMALGTSWEQAP